MSIHFRGNALVVPGEHINIDTAMEWYLGMDVLPPAELAKKLMWKINPLIPQIAKKDDILVGGRDFGYGKVHSAFFLAMSAIGIRCIVADTFSTQLYKQSMLSGFFLLECPNILQVVKMGDEIEVDLETALVINHSDPQTIRGRKLPQFLIDVMSAGGHLAYLKNKGKEV